VTSKNRKHKKPTADNGGAWFGPSDKAKAVFAELDARWAAVLKWGIKVKAPNAHLFVEKWEPFRAAWIAGDCDESTLSAAQIPNLNQAEGYARDAGMPGPVLPPVQGIDIVAARADLNVLDGVDKAAKKAEIDVKAAAKKAADETAHAVPWWVVGLMAAGAVAVVVAVKPRVTVIHEQG
jgi:hypothetical protein